MFFKDLLNNYLRELNCTSKKCSIQYFVKKKYKT